MEISWSSAMGLPLAVHALIFARSKCQISDARTGHLKFCYLENIYWMLCLLVVLSGTRSLLDNGIDLHRERNSGFKYCACAAAALSTATKEDPIGGGKESRHDPRVGQSYYKLACTVPTKRFGVQLINAL